MPLEYKINPLFEALVFMERMAAGETSVSARDSLLMRVRDQDKERLYTCFEPLIKLEERLMSLICVPEEKVLYFFKQIDCAKHDITHFSVMGMLLNNFAYTYDKLDEAGKAICALSDSERRALICYENDNTQNYTPYPDLLGMSFDEFWDFIDSLYIDESEKWRIMEMYRKFDTLFDEGMNILRPIALEFERGNEHIDEIIQRFSLTYPDTFSLQSETERFFSTALPESCVVRPLICGFRWTCAMIDYTQKSDTLKLYIGVYRELLRHVLSDSNPSSYISQTMRVLGDQSKFDILLFLKNKEVYGQTIVNRFKFTAATISQHMAKLVNCGLVTSTVIGNKSYYKMDKTAVRHFIDTQRRMLLDEE